MDEWKRAIVSYFRRNIVVTEMSRLPCLARVAGAIFDMEYRDTNGAPTSMMPRPWRACADGAGAVAVPRPCGDSCFFHDRWGSSQPDLSGGLAAHRRCFGSWLDAAAGDRHAGGTHALRMLCDLAGLPRARRTLTSPDGTHDWWKRVCRRSSRRYQEFVLSSHGRDWGIGRRMQYRDLIPSRLGALHRFAHPHQVGGPVRTMCISTDPLPDDLLQGRWARLSEDQAGRSVPRRRLRAAATEIRHRVLEASDGLEGVEIGCPPCTRPSPTMR